ncbi:MAG: hypothetical protein GTO63_24330 [Anaerolineae bacterium]|nr:hypothetical protein [Anaerolineae bacterium]NIN97851.1 hypothetical protein [Anaerolineae bacterium]
MSTTETLTRAAMMKKLTMEEFDLATDISMRVETLVTCPITGHVLDTRTAVLLTVADHKYVVHPAAMPTLAHTLDSKYPGWTSATLPPAALEALK